MNVEVFSATLSWAELPCLEEDATWCVAGLGLVAAGSTVILSKELSLRPRESETVFQSGPCTTITGFATTIGVLLPARNLMMDGCRQ